MESSRRRVISRVLSGVAQQAHSVVLRFAAAQELQAFSGPPNRSLLPPAQPGARNREPGAGMAACLVPFQALVGGFLRLGQLCRLPSAVRRGFGLTGPAGPDPPGPRAKPRGHRADAEAEGRGRGQRQTTEGSGQKVESSCRGRLRGQRISTSRWRNRGTLPVRHTGSIALTKHSIIP